MPISLLPPLILGAVLVASGISKLRHPDDLAGWKELGVPAAFRRRSLLRLHPWGEIVLALALVVLGGPLGLLAAVACLSLMTGYLWLVAAALVRSRRSAHESACACFGVKRPVTTSTVVRNAWLVFLSIVTAATIWQAPPVGGVLVTIDAQTWPWILGSLAAAVTVVLILWPEGAGDSSAEGAPTHAELPSVGDADSEYVRTRTPAVTVLLADGTAVNLRELAARKPLLLMAVSPTCSSCTPVIDAVPQWRTQLPELDIRLLLGSAPEWSTLRETTEPQSLHDAKQDFRASIEEWPTPTAVLLGADGWLAGGPISGANAISEFVHDIRASLDEAAAAVTSP